MNLPVERNVSGMVIEHQLPKELTLSKLALLDSTNVANLTSLSGTDTGSSTETVVRVSDTTVIDVGERTIRFHSDFHNMFITRIDRMVNNRLMTFT